MERRFFVALPFVLLALMLAKGWMASPFAPDPTAPWLHGNPRAAAPERKAGRERVLAQTARAAAEGAQGQGTGESGEAGPYDTPTATLMARREGAHWVIQGDVLVDESQLDDGAEDVRMATVSGIRLWPGGVVPYEVDPRLEAGNLRDALAEMNARTAVRFVPRGADGRAPEEDYVVFRRAEPEQDVCQSFLGRQGGAQDVVVHPTCGKGQILHEMLHALGFMHEHSREDRDAHVAIHWDNIARARKNQFQKLPAALASPAATPFDFASLLMYSSHAFSANGEATITALDGADYPSQRGGLSEGDIRKVAALYGH